MMTCCAAASQWSDPRFDNIEYFIISQDTALAFRPILRLFSTPLCLFFSFVSAGCNPCCLCSGDTSRLNANHSCYLAVWSVGLHTVNELFAFNQMYLEWLQVLSVSLLHLHNSYTHLSFFLICPKSAYRGSPVSIHTVSVLLLPGHRIGSNLSVSSRTEITYPLYCSFCKNMCSMALIY